MMKYLPKKGETLKRKFKAMRNRNVTQPGLCSWALHFTPQLWSQMEFLGLVHEVSTRKAAPNERLGTCFEVKPSLITMETETAISPETILS